MYDPRFQFIKTLTSPSLLLSKHQTLNDVYVYLLEILHANLAFRYLQLCLSIVDCAMQYN